MGVWLFNLSNASLCVIVSNTCHAKHVMHDTYQMNVGGLSHNPPAVFCYAAAQSGQQLIRQSRGLRLKQHGSICISSTSYQYMASDWEVT